MNRIVPTACRLVLAATCFAAAQSALADPVLWIDDAAGRLGKVDVASGSVTVIGNMGVTMTDIAFDPNGVLYGISFTSLYRVDTATAAPTFIGNTGATLNSLVFDASGTLYAANNRLFSLNTATGAATSIGNGGASYNSSGDLAFVGGNLYLSSGIPNGDSLVRLSTSTGAGTVIGPIGTGAVFGLATNDNVHLYGVAGFGIYDINVGTGAGTLLTSFAGKGLSTANGTAFISEALPPVPEPTTTALLVAGLLAVGAAARRARAPAA